MDVDLEIMTSNRNHKNLDYLNYRNRYNSKTRSHQNLAHGLGYANGSFSNLSQSQLNDNSGSRKSLKNLFFTTVTRKGSNNSGSGASSFFNTNRRRSSTRRSIRPSSRTNRHNPLDIRRSVSSSNHPGVSFFSTNRKSLKKVKVSELRKNWENQMNGNHDGNSGNPYREVIRTQDSRNKTNKDPKPDQITGNSLRRYNSRAKTQAPLYRPNPQNNNQTIGVNLTKKISANNLQNLGKSVSTHKPPTWNAGTQNQITNSNQSNLTKSKKYFGGSLTSLSTVKSQNQTVSSKISSIFDSNTLTLAKRNKDRMYNALFSEDESMPSHLFEAYNTIRPSVLEEPEGNLKGKLDKKKSMSAHNLKELIKNEKQVNSECPVDSSTTLNPSHYKPEPYHYEPRLYTHAPNHQMRYNHTPHGINSNIFPSRTQSHFEVPPLGDFRNASYSVFEMGNPSAPNINRSHFHMGQGAYPVERDPNFMHYVNHYYEQLQKRDEEERKFEQWLSEKMFREAMYRQFCEEQQRAGASTEQVPVVNCRRRSITTKRTETTEFDRFGIGRKSKSKLKIKEKTETEEESVTPSPGLLSGSSPVRRKSLSKLVSQNEEEIFDPTKNKLIRRKSKSMSKIISETSENTSSHFQFPPKLSYNPRSKSRTMGTMFASGLKIPHIPKSPDACRNMVEKVNPRAKDLQDDCLLMRGNSQLQRNKPKRTKTFMGNIVRPMGFLGANRSKMSIC